MKKGILGYGAVYLSGCEKGGGVMGKSALVRVERAK